MLRFSLLGLWLISLLINHLQVVAHSQIILLLFKFVHFMDFAYRVTCFCNDNGFFHGGVEISHEIFSN